MKKRFDTDDGPLDVIGGVSLSVDPGQFIALVGPSGAGKSTLMNIICGFERPDSGSVMVDGRVLEAPSRNGILISQQGSVFPWLTVEENIFFPLVGGTEDEREARADQYIRLVGLEGFENSYPHELSGGMLKRTEIARALAMQPEILYMDEPFSALDAIMSMRLRSELLRLLEKTKQTVLLITHDVEEALHLANRILVLSTRPATIQTVFEVPFPHPRRLSSPELQALKESVLRELGL